MRGCVDMGGCVLVWDVCFWVGRWRGAVVDAYIIG